MSGMRTAIKVLSIIGIVVGALTALFGILLIAGGSLVADQMVNLDDASFAVGAISSVLGAILIFTAVFYIVTGILGIRCANNPLKNIAFIVFCAIDAVFSGLGFIGTLTGDGATASAIISSLVGFAIPVALIVLSVKAKKEIQA